MRFITLGLCLACLFAGSTRAALQLDFDYRYDSFGFFDDPARREALEAAGRVMNRYVDNLDAIIPEGDNGTLVYFSPPDGSSSILLEDQSVPADTLRIFVAGRPLAGSLAQTIDAPLSGAGGDPEWVDTVRYRGQLGAASRPATDFGPSLSVMSFNQDLTEVPWHFGLSTDGLDSNEFDFITVAFHELMHVMGFGITGSFANRVNDANEFTGAAAVRVGSETNPNLKVVGAGRIAHHWESGTKSPWNGELQEAVVAPGVFPGRRAFPTRLDRASLIDIGWEPATAGDANRDRLFNSSDLVAVFGGGLYDTGQLAGWSDGDWNDNALFESGDLVEAFQTGTYGEPALFAIDAGPVDEMRVRFVPEPKTIHLLSISAVLSLGHRRRLRTAAQ